MYFFMHQTVYSVPVLVIMNARKNMIHAHYIKKGTDKETNNFIQKNRKKKQNTPYLLMVMI